MPQGRTVGQPVEQPDALKVLLVESHALVRAALRVVLERVPGVSVLAATDDPDEACRTFADRRCDIVVLNVGSGPLDGVELTRRLARGGARVLAISTSAQEGLVMDAVLAGATGILLSHAGPDALEQALHALAQGSAYLPDSPTFSRPRLPAATDGELSLRQRQVLRLIAEGVSTRDSARRLGVSVKTIETHRANLMRRLQIRDVAGLVRYAIRIGLVSSER